MRPTEKNIENLIQNLNDPTRPELDRKILEDCFAELDNQKSSPPVSSPNIWSVIMHNKITKPIAAAIIIIAGFFVLTLFNNTIPKAYALTDTIEAYKSIQWLHVSLTKIFSWGEERTTEVWVECDKQGNTTRIRGQVSTGGSLVGPITITNNFQDEDVWLPQHNLRFLGYSNPESLLPYDASELDPKLLFETLTEQEKRGQAIVNINEPLEKSEPITVTVTYPAGSKSESRKKVFYIDQATKLVTRIDKYELNDQEPRLYQTREFSDYNQPINPMMFTLDDEIPENAQTVDMTGMEEGLARGNMTKEEITIEVTRQFFEAVITGDYDRAGKLYLGVPGILVEKGFMDAQILKILSFGPVYPDPDPDSNTMICSCKLLAEFDGDYYEADIYEVFVRPASGQPDKWVICGTSSSYAPASGSVILSHDGVNLDAVTYHGLVPRELMQKWLLLDAIRIEVRGDTLFPSEETQKIEFDTNQIDVSQFEPRVTIGQKDYHWSLLENDYGTINLSNVDENWYLITYAWAQIDMPEEKQAVLGIGSDDGVKVWLNGELVHENWTSRGVGIDNDRVPVTFKKGMNQLVLKIQNGGGPWGFCCRMLEE